MAKITVTESGVVVVGNGDTVIIDIPGGGEVTIVADPTENVNTVKIEFEDDSHADIVNVELSTFAKNKLHIDIRDYDSTDRINLVGSYDRGVDPKHDDEFEFKYIGADGQEYTGFVHAKDKGENDFTADPTPIIICFAAGARLHTTLGWTPVEALRPWDCVATRDRGFQPVRWVGECRLSRRDLARHPDLRPVVVEPSSLGPGMPARRIRLSPHHSVLVSGWRLQLAFGLDEALVPIKALIDGVTIYSDPAPAPVQYVHVLLTDHAVLDADGCAAESLLQAPQSARALDAGTAGWEMRGPDQSAFRECSRIPARPCLTMREARALSTFEAPAAIPASPPARRAG